MLQACYAYYHYVTCLIQPRFETENALIPSINIVAVIYDSTVVSGFV